MNKNFKITRDQLHAAAVAFAAADAPKLHWDMLLDEGRAYYERTVQLMFEAAFPGFVTVEDDGNVEQGFSLDVDEGEIPKSLPISTNNSVRLEHTKTVLTNAHHRYDCKGKHCTLHNRSSHHMRGFPQVWNSTDVRMDRVCSHGFSHPDPDEFLDARNAFHTCDGCCNIPKKPFKEDDFSDIPF